MIHGSGRWWLSGVILLAAIWMSAAATSAVTVQGILVEIKSGSSNPETISVQLLKDGALAGTAETGVAVPDVGSGDCPNTAWNISLGGASDLWGDTWAVADVNDPDFGLHIVCTSNGSRNVDAARITVYTDVGTYGPRYVTCTSGTWNQTNGAIGDPSTVSNGCANTGAVDKYLDLACFGFNIQTTATITVTKTVVGAPPGTDWAFTGSSTIGSFTLDKAGATSAPFTVTPGQSYTITETTKTGYTTTYKVNGGAVQSGASASVTPSAGEAVTIEFINTAADATITVTKTVVGAPPGTDWAFTGSSTIGSFTLDKAGATSAPFSVTPGQSYTITETTKTGYTTTYKVNGGAVQSGTSASVTPSAGQAVTIEFINTAQPGGITVVKAADPKSGMDFEFGGALEGKFWLDDASPDDLDGVPNQRSWDDLNPGTYQIYEVVPSGWTCQVSSVPSDATTSWFDPPSGRMYAEVDLDAGESITVTFTNTKPYCSLTIYKETVPDGGEGFEFTDDVEGPFSFVLNDGGSKAFTEIAPGQYTIIESALPVLPPPANPWELASIESTGDGQVVFGDGTTTHPQFQDGDDRVIITLQDGDDGVLIFRNSRDGGGGGGGAGGGSVGFNQAPICCAGPDRDVCVGEHVCLDATCTVDPDNPTGLSYEWSFSVWYYLNGKPVLHVPEGSRVAETMEASDTPFACFTPDLPGDYVLLVTVTDPYGVSCVDEITIHAEECGTTYTCWYPDGWNLFSLPVQPVNSSAEVILGTTSADTAAYRYTDGYEEAETLGPLEGFWTHFVNPDSISVLGRQIQDDTVLRLAQAGWHLISSPFSIDWERVLVYVNGVERYVDEDVARSVIGEFCACYDPEAEVYRVSDELLPCQGYWVRTYEPDVQLKFEWTQYTQSRPPAEGGCSGPQTTQVPAPPETSEASQASILAYPNPVRHSTVHFELSGLLQAESIRVSVFTASGKRVWSGEASGHVLDWVPRSDDGGRLPWGPYLYCMEGLIDGIWMRAGCSILFLAEVD